ncbi:glucose-1-phosphate adenylyltransferase subunit GlgD [Clostridiales bacterium COT073_COT-073]|nr:glucose-1-phosphate adenylyltransferase subunit GlgD [Clostridiales bacterium COT073_COT-073]
MNNIFGIITTGNQKPLLGELAMKRSVSAMPVAGKYRAIDFVLSNMVNSGIDKVGVVTQYSYRSLTDHLGAGKEWDLDRRNEGLFLFPPYLSMEHKGWYKGTADGMYQNISFLKRSHEEYVLIATGNCIYSTTYNGLLEKHIETGADITMMYYDMAGTPLEELREFGQIKVDETGRVVDLMEKPLSPKDTVVSMGVYVLKRELLIELLEESSSHGYYDFVRDILIRKVHELKIYGYEFKGYWRTVNSISWYYKINMDFLNKDVREDLFGGGKKVFTKVKDETPAKYNPEAEVKNSIIADGCIIEGYVENSILFRGVRVGKNSRVVNSIIMQGSVIENDVSLEHVIFDKEITITANHSLKGEVTAPMIVGKNRKI